MEEEIDRRRRDRADEDSPRFVARARKDRSSPGNGRDRGGESGEDERVDKADLRNEEFGDVEGRKIVRRRAAKLLGEVAQPCAAFQAANGANTASATASPANSAGEPSQRRSDGAATRAKPTPAAKKTAVNFDSSAKPSASPSTTSQRALPVRQSSTRAARPRVQNATSGASGVTKTAPTTTSGIAIHISAASAAFLPS